VNRAERARAIAQHPATDFDSFPVTGGWSVPNPVTRPHFYEHIVSGDTIDISENDSKNARSAQATGDDSEPTGRTHHT